MGGIFSTLFLVSSLYIYCIKETLNRVISKVVFWTTQRGIRDSEVIFSRNDLKFTAHIVQYVYSEKMGKIQMFKNTQVIALLGGSTYIKFHHRTSNKKDQNCGPTPKATQGPGTKIRCLKCYHFTCWVMSQRSQISHLKMIRLLVFEQTKKSEKRKVFFGHLKVQDAKF